MDVLIVVDMQKALMIGNEKCDIDQVLKRIERLSDRLRRRGGRIVYIQHAGPQESDFAPQSPGWVLFDALKPAEQDLTIHKRFNDAFFRTSLEADLRDMAPNRVLIAGWATDFCVDATVRTAAALGFRTAVVADCHTVSDRPGLSAQEIIEYHHWKWKQIISPHPVEIIEGIRI
jgi:nicotinamidase-related amidase